MTRLSRELPDETATAALGEALAAGLDEGGAVIHLQGSLGAGKTSLCRAFLRALGETGPVRSPTYTLVEPYRPGGRRVFHMDLYRLADPEELEFLGVRELDETDAVLLIEWPERGRGMLPPADLVIELRHAEAGRSASLSAASERGEAVLSGLLASQTTAGITRRSPE